jgi:hypothetical protein
MNVTLWILQLLLAVLFAASGTKGNVKAVELSSGVGSATPKLARLLPSGGRN